MPFAKEQPPEGEEASDEMKAVEKQFYELAIAGLNKKVIRLKSDYVKIGEKNVELEDQMKKMVEDRQDVTAYLNRTLNQKLVTIQELEYNLNEISQARRNENENAKKLNAECEIKYKIMHENLTAENKLLTDKLSAVKIDDLMAKFKLQEQELKEQEVKHKALLYEMEKKLILDKERMRKDVEDQLLALSNEFTKGSDVRVAASTQRLLRENIALNNEMDRMISTQERLQRENQEMKNEHLKVTGKYEDSVDLQKRLIKTAEQRLEIIKRLTNECENLRDQKTSLKDVIRGLEAAQKTMKDKSDELSKLNEKITILKQHVHVIERDRQSLKCEATFYRDEYERATKIVRYVKFSVKSVMKGEKDQHDQAFREYQRKNLLTDLMSIVNDLEKQEKKPSLETIPSVHEVHSKRSSGTGPKGGANSITENMPQLKVYSSFLSPSIRSLEVFRTAEEPETENELLDPITASGSILFSSSSENDSVNHLGQDDENIFQKQLRQTGVLLTEQEFESEAEAALKAVVDEDGESGKLDGSITEAMPLEPEEDVLKVVEDAAS